MAAIRIIRSLRAFHRESQANVAVTFALALVPLTMAVGAAVDYSGSIAVKAAMQAAADGTALTMGKKGAMSAADLQSAASAWFKGVFTNSQAQNVQVTATNSTASAVTVSATASVSPNLLGLFGLKQINLAVSSTASWGTTKLQIALVLDNTGSMAEYNKISALQTASHQLLQQLQNLATNPGDVQVAIVPFTTDVNVGKSNASANWVKWTYSALGGFGFGFGGSGTTTKTVSQSGWTGCVTDRDQNYDVTNAAAGAAAVATQFPADNPLFGCPPQMVPLSSNWSTLNALIDQMTPLGETNLTIGLTWGWEALTLGSPLNPPAPAPGTQQVIIFMTDGFNTANRWTNALFGSGTTADIDARTQLVCQNIKTAGITVYTVQVDTGGESPPSTLLQNCASDIGKWFYMNNASELVTTFQQIGTSLVSLHLTN
jgi:Flp pilus assembly protein TadG